MDRPFPLSLRCILVFGGLLCAGCSTGLRLAYDNLDRLAPWQLSNYVELEPAQKVAFDAAFNPLWNWHRQTQLPAYAKDLREMAAALEQGPPKHEIAGSYLQRIEKHGEKLAEKVLPDVERLLLLLEDDQVVKLIDSLRARIEKEERKLAGETPTARRQRFADNISKSMDWWIGDLNAAQKDVVDEAWIDGLAALRSPEQRRQTRLDNLQRLAGLFNSRRAAGFGERLRNFGEDDPVQAASQLRMQALRLEIIARMDDRQRNKLRGRLLGLAADFIALSKETVASEARPGA